MTLVYISNYMNHHQLPLCLELRRLLGDDFRFIALTSVSEERKKLGYADMNREHDFVISVTDEGIGDDRIIKMCNECDILLVGSAHDRYFYERLRMGKPTVKCSERYFKNEQRLTDLPKNLVCALKHIRKYQRYPLYYLCASAYTKADVNKFADYSQRTFKWGYFPDTFRAEDADGLRKQKREASLLWVARFLDWKHPEHVLYVAKRLKEEGYSFSAEMLGVGPMHEEILSRIRSEGLSDCLKAPGSVPSGEVQDKMRASQIFLFTSDHKEGWGAVLNEAMGNGCAVVASVAAGSTPYLVRDGENGSVYTDKEELYEKVKELLDNSQLRERLSDSAYKTISETWNPRIAAERLVALCNAILSGESLDLFEEGPCSRA
ncbi:MAG: glycosyltransferase [Clostridia bacterium]|nr:glycosyltransferase [Clostridia bacterium]